MSSNNLASHEEVDGPSAHLDPVHSKSLESYHHHQASGSTLVPTRDLEPDQSDFHDAYDAYDSGPSKHAPFPETSDSQQDLLSVRQSRTLYDTKGTSVPRYESLEYANAEAPQDQPPLTAKGWRSVIPDGASYPVQQRIEAKRRGLGRQKYPFVSWTFAAIMISVLIYELVVNNHFQGTPISFKPVVNPMLGPSTSALIEFGGRFPPCMKLVQGIPIDSQIACLNDTANPPTELCSLEETCAFGGFNSKTPNQWFRFITPIFIHAGIIHLLLNMSAQLTSSAQIEREMGSGGFLVLYMAAGIFGNVLGGNFALAVSPSVGASGAIFGTIAATWVDLFAHWSIISRPGRRFALQTLELVIGVACGYIPYVDNFAHLGGFFMGLLCSMTLYPIISRTKTHRSITWFLRLAAIPIAAVMFFVLIRNFYTADPYASCEGCRYLSCFPLKSNNYCHGPHNQQFLLLEFLLKSLASWYIGLHLGLFFGPLILYTLLYTLDMTVLFLPTGPAAVFYMLFDYDLSTVVTRLTK